MPENLFQCFIKVFMVKCLFGHMHKLHLSIRLKFSDENFTLFLLRRIFKNLSLKMNLCNNFQYRIFEVINRTLNRGKKRK